MPKLKSSEIDFIMKMKKVSYSNCKIAEILGVTEGAIRYRKKRKEEAKTDGRKDKPSKLDQYHSLIELWIEENKQKSH